MTRTEQDLRHRLAMLEPGVAAKDQIEEFARQLAARPSPPIRPFGRVRRFGPLVALPAVALATAAVVLAASSLAPDGAGDRERVTALHPPGPSGISWRWLFSIDSPPAGWTPMIEDIGSQYQEAVLVGPGDVVCTLQVFEAGAFDTARIGADAAPVSVKGAEATFATVEATGKPFPTVVWQYAPGAYALSICNQGSVDVQGDALAAASALTARQRPFTFPFAVGYLPADAAVLMAYTSMRGPGAVLHISTLATGIDLTRGEVDPRDLDGARTMTVDTVDGPRPAAYRDGTLYVLYAGFYVSIGDQPRTPDLDELIRIAENLTIAPDPMDPATWFDAQDALP